MVAANNAFRSTWSKTSFEERANYLDRIAAAIEVRLESLKLDTVCTMPCRWGDDRRVRRNLRTWNQRMQGRR